MIQNGRLCSQPIPFLGRESWTSPPPWAHSCPLQPPAEKSHPHALGWRMRGRRGAERGRTHCVPDVPLAVPLILTLMAVLKQTQRAPCRHGVSPGPRSSRVTAGAWVPGHHTPPRGRACLAPGQPGQAHRVCLPKKGFTQWLNFLLPLIYYRVSGHKGSTGSVIAPEGGSGRYGLGAHASVWRTRPQAPWMEGACLNTPTCPDRAWCTAGRCFVLGRGARGWLFHCFISSL